MDQTIVNTALVNWRKAVLKALKLNSNKIQRSTGIPIYYVNRWVSGHAVPDYVEMTIDNFFGEIGTALDKLKGKLNLN